MATDLSPAALAIYKNRYLAKVRSLDDQLRRDVEKASRLRATIVLRVRNEDDVGAANPIGVPPGEDSNLPDEDESQFLHTGKVAQCPGDICFEASVLGICGTQGDNPTVDQLGEFVIGHPRELVAGDQRVAIP